MKLNGLQHIGIPTKDFGASKIFYESLGFSLINEEMNVGSKVGFFELNGTIIEIWEDKTTECRGAIDHLALDTDDIDEVFNSIQDLGYELLEKILWNYRSGKMESVTLISTDQIMRL